MIANSQLQETHAKLDRFGEEEVNQYLVGLLKPMKSKESKARIYEMGGPPLWMLLMPKYS